jgi:hypothetical protein
MQKLILNGPIGSSTAVCMLCMWTPTTGVRTCPFQVYITTAFVLSGEPDMSVLQQCGRTVAIVFSLNYRYQYNQLQRFVDMRS